LQLKCEKYEKYAFTVFLTKVAIKSGIYAQASYRTVIYSSDVFTYNAKYFQTLSGEKWRSFAKSLRSMLKPRSTLHEAAWQFNSFVHSSGLMFGRVISTIAFRSLSQFKSVIKESVTILK